KESGTKEAEFGYGGYYVHRPSGLYLTWYRQYDPSIARWLSRDPIGEQGGLNLYAYVENNPVLLVDSLGLFAWDGDSPYLPDPNRKPPDWDNTWPTGKDGRGEYSQDPKTGRKYYPHAEDRAHWDHYDYCDEKGKDKRYPDKSIKPRPGQKKLKPNQSADDPWPKACSPSDVVPCHKPYIPIKKPWEHPWWTPPEIKPKTKTLPGTNLPDCCSRM
ncbi:MAG: RHS repeat-associated core domain-containing protein, partial [Blastocatellia bacterium]|nr:RHS repeat-associated core domain-containing protein [Blastocatellia bacterium]